MYSEELERFIQLVIADGEVSDKERGVLHKKAEKEGIDLDEIDVYVDGLIAEMKVKNASVQAPPVATPSQPKSAKWGDLNKCPQCGAVVMAGSARCEECGYAYRNIEAVSSVEKFSNMLAQIEKEEGPDDDLFGSFLSMAGMSKRDKRLSTAIQNFPIPNAKEDLMEFLMFLKPKTSMNAGNSQTVCQAYKAKYKECKKKAEVFFKDDPAVMEILKKDKKRWF